MLDNLLFTCNALLPILLLIVLGYVLKKFKFFSPEFLKMANKLCFRVFIPCLLFYNVYCISDLGNFNWGFIAFVVIAIVLLFLVGMVIGILSSKDGKQQSVIHQCVFRTNYAIIGIPLAALLATDSGEAVALAAVVSAFSIPLFNLFAVIALSIYDKDPESNKHVSIKKILLNIIKNPLIIAVVLGLITLLIRNGLTSANIDFTIKDNIPFLYKTLEMAKGVASPLALVILGGGFTFAAVSKLKKQIIIGVSARLVVVPIVCLTIAYLLGYRGTEFPALIGLFATPVAVSSVPMASEMNQDDELAGQLVVWTSLLSSLSLFIIILIAKSIGAL